MKRTDLTSLEEDAFEEALDQYDGFCDITDSPDEVLEEADRLLRKHGLEIEVADGGDTSTLFRIIKRKGDKRNG